MSRTFLILVLLCLAPVTGPAANGSTIKFPSPDGRYALRIAEPSKDDSGEREVEIIEKESGKVAVNLGTAYSKHLSETVLVWSTDSKWAAYGTRGDREGETSVYFWNGSAFDEVRLPADLPIPKIKFGKSASGGVKNYGGAVTPLRWLKSGDLELSSELTMMSHGDGRSYTGVVVLTVGFDQQHHAFVRKVGETKTQVDP